MQLAIIFLLGLSIWGAFTISRGDSYRRNCAVAFVIGLVLMPIAVCAALLAKLFGLTLLLLLAGVWLLAELLTRALGWNASDDE